MLTPSIGKKRWLAHVADGGLLLPGAGSKGRLYDILMECLESHRLIFRVDARSKKKSSGPKKRDLVEVSEGPDGRL